MDDILDKNQKLLNIALYGWRYKFLTYKARSLKSSLLSRLQTNWV